MPISRRLFFALPLFSRPLLSAEPLRIALTMLSLSPCAPCRHYVFRQLSRHYADAAVSLPCRAAMIPVQRPPSTAADLCRAPRTRRLTLTCQRPPCFDTLLSAALPAMRHAPLFFAFRFAAAPSFRLMLSFHLRQPPIFISLIAFAFLSILHFHFAIRDILRLLTLIAFSISPLPPRCHYFTPRRHVAIAAYADFSILRFAAMPFRWLPFYAIQRCAIFAIFATRHYFAIDFFFSPRRCAAAANRCCLPHAFDAAIIRRHALIFDASPACQRCCRQRRLLMMPRRRALPPPPLFDAITLSLCFLLHFRFRC